MLKCFVVVVVVKKVVRRENKEKKGKLTGKTTFIMSLCTYGFWALLLFIVLNVAVWVEAADAERSHLHSQWRDKKGGKRRGSEENKIKRKEGTEGAKLL